MVIKKLTILLIFICAIGSNGVIAAIVMPENSNQKLFINLTSDEINRAAMAIEFSTKVLRQKKIPVTIFLSLEGTRIANKNIPERKHVNGKSLQDMLSKFMSKGGHVIMCVTCMENVAGVSKDDVIKGVQFSGGMTALFENGTRVLSY